MTTTKVLLGLAVILTVGYYTVDLQRKFDELGKLYMIVYKERTELKEENDKLRKMYTDLRAEVVKGDRP